MAHFRFLMLPEPGHILPTLRVAKRLETRGHRVSYASLCAVQAFLKQYSLECVRILRKAFPEESQEFLPSLVFRKRLTAHAALTGYTLSELVSSELPPHEFDTLLCDSKIIDCCGVALGQLLGRRVIAIQTDLPDATIPAVEYMPKIVLCPRELHMPHETLLHNDLTLYAEPSVFRSRNEKVLDSRAGVDKLIYCSLGTQSLRYRDRFRILKAIIDAFKAKRFHLLIHANSDYSALRSIVLPSNVEVVESARQLEALRVAKLFITHGGLGSIKEAVMAGVPCLVIPFDFDQPRNGERIHHHKLGTYCSPAQCTAERVWRLASQVMEDTNITQSVDQMRRTFWKYETEAPATEFILRES
jgi:UDP:flavonoid glycosyltransferase YjiC (YdhE family)